jgi:hypothetical protein
VFDAAEYFTKKASSAGHGLTRSTDFYMLGDSSSVKRLIKYGEKQIKINTAGKYKEQL